MGGYFCAFEILFVPEICHVGFWGLFSGGSGGDGGDARERDGKDDEGLEVHCSGGGWEVEFESAYWYRGN